MLSHPIIIRRLKRGHIVVLSIKLQFVKYVFGARPFSNPEYKTIKIKRVIII
jgi:hypothetical protein